VNNFEKDEYIVYIYEVNSIAACNRYEIFRKRETYLLS